MFVVIDTNVIVSAILSPQGKPARIFKQFLDGGLTLCLDDRIFREYEEVLYRPKFRFNRESVHAILNLIQIQGVFVNPPLCNLSFSDEADKKFFEVAKFCNAVLITGNRKHYPDDPLVKSVQEF